MNDAQGILAVLLYGLLTALATGLGALPFLFVRRVGAPVVAYANAVASGLMLGASFGLVLEGTAHGRWQTAAGANIGVLAILAAQRWLVRHDVIFGPPGDAGAGKTLLLLAVMTVHSFSEGIAVGAAFAGGLPLATMITIAVAVHNVPEGLAISAVLRPRGRSVAACAGWSIFSSLPQPLMAVPAFLFVDAFRPLLPWGMGFAAGAMVLMVFLELLPEAYEREELHRGIAVLFSVSLVAMIVFQHFL